MVAIRMITIIGIIAVLLAAMWAVRKIARWFGVNPDPQQTRGRG